MADFRRYARGDVAAAIGRIAVHDDDVFVPVDFEHADSVRKLVAFVVSKHNTSLEDHD